MAEGGQSLNFSEEEEKTTIDLKMEVDSLQVLLERNRSERENELRQIQNSSRPVTGQASRETIGHFLAKNIEVRENAQATGKENVPLNSSNCEEHRPNAVIVEIQGLSQQHRVSDVLQSTAFRRHLENLIRGSIPRSSPPTSRQQTPAQSLRPSPAPETGPFPSAPVVDDLVNSIVPGSPDISDRESVSSHSTNSSVDPATQIRDPRGLLAQHLQNGATPPPPPFPPANRIGNEAQPSWDNVAELHRETIVQEISELVHQQLVTSSLQGDFRHTLEYHMQGRLESTGTDGQRVQDFIQSIPQSTLHVRNDFSNIGVIPPAAQDNWDNVSVTSITAASVPFRQTNLHLNQEIASLKAQMAEMRNMLKVSFELQMDIQRSIRQEVAAGIAAATGGTTAPPATVPKSKPVNDTHCLICLDNFSDSVLYQCGHMCVCYPCGRHLMDRNAKCPVCRAPIRDIIRAYRCNED